MAAGAVPASVRMLQKGPNNEKRDAAIALCNCAGSADILVSSSAHITMARIWHREGQLNAQRDLNGTDGTEMAQMAR